MADKVVFAISLADLVSAPAKRMQKELAHMRSDFLAAQSSALASAKSEKLRQGEMMASARAMLAENQGAATLEKSITSLERALAKSAATGNVSAYRKQSRDLAALRDELSRTDVSGLRAAESLQKQAAAAGQAAKALSEQAAKASESAAEIAEKIDEASKSAGEFAEKLVAGWEVASELGKKIGESAIELGEFALEAVQTKQAAQSMFAAMAGGTEKGTELFEMVENLATSLPQTKDQLTAWSKEFTAMGVLDSKALRSDLQATASAAALMGDSGAEAFETFEKKITESVATTGKLKLADKQLASLAQTGANVTDVAAQMGVSAKQLQEKLKAGTVSAQAFGDALNAALIAKGAGPLDRMAGSMKSLGDKLKESIGDMFEDIDVSPFTDALREVVSLFSQTSASGQVMKQVVGGFFTQFFKWAGRAVLETKHMFLGTIILGLKAYIAIKPWIPLLKVIGEVVLVAGAAFLLSFTPAVLSAVAALGVLVAEAAIAAAPFIAIGLAVVGVYEAFKNWGAIKAVISKTAADVEAWALGVGKRFDDFAAELFTRAVSAGANMVSGLLQGLANGAGELVKGVANLGHKAIGAFKGALGISSPSREFMKLGDFAAKGFTIGVRASNDNVRGATEGLAAAATEGAARGVSGAASVTAAASPPPAPAGKGGGVTVNVEKGAITINGAQGDAAELTEHAVSLIFEKVALMQGAA